MINKHRTDKVSFGFGLAFVTVALWWLIGVQLEIVLPTAGWFVAGGLILFGVIGLAGSLWPSRRNEPISPGGTPVGELGSDPEPW
jgi:hypothetical protein